MLESLHLKNVGPAPEMELELGERLNLITGDNGLGKSFLLDVAWWALTRTWARHLVMPRRPPAKPEIAYRYTKATKGAFSFIADFDRGAEKWKVNRGRPPIPGLVLYVQVDGGFSVWDPARNYWKVDELDRPNAYLFTADEIWEGNGYCEGLVRDWGSWQRENGETFEIFKRVLGALSPSDTEPLEPGELLKIGLSDPKRYPSLRMPYGEDIAIVHASAGMRRVVALAYLLVWAWQEHRAAAQLRGVAEAREVIFLVDEIEGHLHPQWQRRIVPALLDVMEALTSLESRVQLITATHSALVLASVEPVFDEERDAWFDLDLEDGEVHLRKRPYVRLGEVGNWLVSDAFDLKEPRSLEGERALRAAQALLSTPTPSIEEIDAADEQLRRAGLPDIDPFWVRWSYFVEQAKRTKQGEQP
jgi:hypothetical protein